MTLIVARRCNPHPLGARADLHGRHDPVDRDGRGRGHASGATGSRSGHSHRDALAGVASHDLVRRTGRARNHDAVAQPGEREGRRAGPRPGIGGQHATDRRGSGDRGTPRGDRSVAHGGQHDELVTVPWRRPGTAPAIRALSPFPRSAALTTWLREVSPAIGVVPRNHRSVSVTPAQVPRRRGHGQRGADLPGPRELGGGGGGGCVAQAATTGLLTAVAVPARWTCRCSGP